MAGPGDADAGDALPLRPPRRVRRRNRLPAAALALLIAISTARAATPETSCDIAALKAEHDWNLPPGILSAVGTVESGRPGPTGLAPWPWTINAAGRGTFHDSKGDAVATVLAIMQSGYPYIDVGCFQVDIAYHAGVFRSLDEAFDPDHNAQAAARILLTNRIGAPDWNTAIARYHSATPERGGPYLDRVRQLLPVSTSRALSAQVQDTPSPPLTPMPAAKLPAAKLPVVIYALPIAAVSPSRTRRTSTR